MSGRDALRWLLSSRLLSRGFARATEGTVTVFVLHRIAGAGHPYEGTPEETITAALARLRRDRYHLVGLDEVVAAGLDGRTLPRRSIAFTADDGYRDQAEVLAPLFAAFDCPLTIFLTSGFLDRKIVPWWDRVGEATHASARESVRITVGDKVLDLSFAGPYCRRESTYTFLRLAKRLADEQRQRAVERLVIASGVDVPTTPFGPFQPMAWDDARRLEAGGLVRFGPHSVRHPILARLSGADEVAQEVQGSWRRVRTELAAPLGVFCYPNGEAADYGEREIRVARAAGFAAAVTVDHHPIMVADLRHEERRFTLGRVPFPSTVTQVVQRASGLDHLRRTRPQRSKAN